MFGRQTAGEARDRQVKASAKEAYGAILADKTGTELVKYAIYLDKNTPCGRRISTCWMDLAWPKPRPVRSFK